MIAGFDDCQLLARHHDHRQQFRNQGRFPQAAAFKAGSTDQRAIACFLLTVTTERTVPVGSAVAKHNLFEISNSDGPLSASKRRFPPSSGCKTQPLQQQGSAPGLAALRSHGGSLPADGVAFQLKPRQSRNQMRMIPGHCIAMIASLR